MRSLGILELPPDQIKATDILALLDRRALEGPMLDYKSERTRDFPKHVAAMANTYGGLLLVGINGPDRGGTMPFTIAGAEDHDADAIRDQCFQTLEPPFCPDINTIEVHGKRIVVVRVVPDSRLRPVVYRGGIYIRIGDSTRAADRRHIISLCKEPSPASMGTSPLGSLFPRHYGGSLVGVSPQAPALVVRLASAVGPLPPRPRMGTRERNALLHSLESSPLTELLTQWQPHRGDLEGRVSWQLSGHVSSAGFSARWSVDGAFVQAAALFRFAASPGDPPGASLVLDAIIEHSSEDQDALKDGRSVRLIELPDLAKLLAALLNTSATHIPGACYAPLLGTSVWETYPFHGFLEANGASLADVIRIDRPVIGEAASTKRADWNSAFSLGLEGDMEPVAMAVYDWLVSLLLDLGYDDPEGFLSGVMAQGFESPTA